VGCCCGFTPYTGVDAFGCDAMFRGSGDVEG